MNRLSLNFELTTAELKNGRFNHLLQIESFD